MLLSGSQEGPWFMTSADDLLRMLAQIPISPLIAWKLLLQCCVCCLECEGRVGRYLRALSLFCEQFLHVATLTSVKILKCYVVMYALYL